MQVHDCGADSEISSEFSDVDLGDVRLNRRLGALASKLADRSGESFPKALDDAELEAAYRFLGNAKVTPEAILAPHFRQSARRASRCKRIIVAHDTTAFEFGGPTKREGLGHLIRPSAQGFFGHFALALSADGKRRPIGLLSLETIFRLKKPIGHKNWTKKQSLGESARWLRGVEDTESRLSGAVEAIHVMDRDGWIIVLLLVKCLEF